MNFLLKAFLVRFFSVHVGGRLSFHATSAATISLLAAVNCFGADFWVAQNATGSGSGADTNDCMALGWPSASPGDTVHLCGTFTNVFNVSGSGSPGNPITIHFEPNAVFTAPTLANNATFLAFGSQSYLVIDGGQNGLIQLTDNGTVAANGGPFDYQNNCGGIGGGYGRDVFIKNLSVRNIYQRTTNTEATSPQGGDGSDIYYIGSGLTVSNCVLGEAANGIAVTYNAVLTSNLTVIDCVLTNFNHGFTLGVGGVASPVFDNLIIRSNVFDGGDMFESADGGPELGFHRNPIFLFNESSDGLGCISNIEISCNFIRMGAHPKSGTAGTAAMFFDLYRNDQSAHVRVFNNISTLVWPLNYSGGGGYFQGGGTDVLLANNTAVAWSGSGNYGTGAFTLSGTNGLAYNNILVSKSGAEMYTFAYTSGAGNSATNYAFTAQVNSGLQFDYNIYNGQSGASEFAVIIFSLDGGGVWYESLVDTLGEWQTWWSPRDAHSLTNTVQLAANFAPLTNDVVAIGNGTNLTAFAIADNLPGLTKDFSGNPRPATGNWTIGAYEVTGSHNHTRQSPEDRRGSGKTKHGREQRRGNNMSEHIIKPKDRNEITPKTRVPIYLLGSFLGLAIYGTIGVISFLSDTRFDYMFAHVVSPFVVHVEYIFTRTTDKSSPHAGCNCASPETLVQLPVDGRLLPFLWSTPADCRRWQTPSSSSRCRMGQEHHSSAARSWPQAGRCS